MLVNKALGIASIRTKNTFIINECITNFNSARSGVACELESSCENNILRNAAYRMALIEYCKPYKK